MALKTPAAVVATSLGQDHFSNILKSRGGSSAVARDLGVSRQRVHEWQTGRKQPDLDTRLMLEGRYQIPSAAWDQPLHATPADRRKPRLPTPRDGLVSTHAGEVIEQSSGRAQLTDLLLDVHRKREIAAGTEHLKLAAVEANLLKQLIAAEDHEIARQTDLFTSAMFLDWVGRTLDALAPWPDSIAALEKVWGLG